MNSIVNLYSGVYLTAIGMTPPRQPEHHDDYPAHDMHKSKLLSLLRRIRPAVAAARKWFPKGTVPDIGIKAPNQWIGI